MDRRAETGYKVQGTSKIAKTLVYSFFLTGIISCIVPCALCRDAFGAERWPGVDESVVEKFAREHGREARKPLINTDQGDLLLFAFLLAGTAGGFAAGYYWRMLLEGKAKGNGKEKRK
jgi:cobalt/nickel transport protein